MQKRNAPFSAPLFGDLTSRRLDPPAFHGRGAFAVFRLAVATLFASVLLVSCSPGKSNGKVPQPEELASELRVLENTLAQGLNELTIDTATALSFVEKAQQYAAHFAQDSLAPNFLFRAADVARGLGDYELALQLWGKVARDYEDSPRAPQSLFFQAFTLDNDMRDHTAARSAYETFLERYPKHPMAKDAMALLEVLNSGKTTEELIREFQQQNQE
jgi:tetratricopeptide (TPR) repeat protein